MYYATCPTCKTDRPLKKDGTFRKHLQYAGKHWKCWECPGSGTKAEGEIYHNDIPQPE